MSINSPRPQNYTIDILDGDTELVVGTTDTKYTEYFPLPADASFGLDLDIESGGTVDVKVELEQGNKVPNDKASDADWAVGDEISSGITSTGTFLGAVSPVATQWARLKLTGQGSNAATTKVTRAKLCISKNH